MGRKSGTVRNFNGMKDVIITGLVNKTFLGEVIAHLADQGEVDLCFGEKS